MMRRALRGDEIRSLMKILDYFYGRGAGSPLRGKKVLGMFSGKTGRLRRVIANGKEILVMRASDFTPILTEDGLALLGRWVRRKIVVNKEAEDALRQGAKTVFCKHVVKVEGHVKPRDEVVIIGESGELLGVGRAVLPGRYMTQFKLGRAVMVRRGGHVSHKSA